MKGILQSAFCILICVLAGCPKPPAPKPAVPVPRPALPTAALSIKDAVAHVELASKDPDRMQGLMFRSNMAQDSGMLFVFEDQDYRSFWMKNTWIPLSIAFLDSAGVIINILEMSPEDTTSRYLSARPAKYALEMNSGWFQQHSLRPGDTVHGLPQRTRQPLQSAQRKTTFLDLSEPVNILHCLYPCPNCFWSLYCCSV